MKIFWLLFLLTAGSFEGPVGVYTSESGCRLQGEELKRILSRHYECRPATDIVLPYFKGKCLGDGGDFCPEKPEKVKEKEIFYEKAC